MVFGRRNYVLILVGVVAVVIGFVMMRLENEVDGFISLYISPLLIMAGYIEVLYGIMVDPDREARKADEGETDGRRVRARSETA